MCRWPGWAIRVGKCSVRSQRCGDINYFSVFYCEIGLGCKYNGETNQQRQNENQHRSSFEAPGRNLMAARPHPYLHCFVCSISNLTETSILDSREIGRASCRER